MLQISEFENKVTTVAATQSRKEEERLSVLHELDIINSSRSAEFDSLTQFAAILFSVPICLISLVDKDHQWYKSSFGLETESAPREQSFCAYTLISPDTDVLLVPDATHDPRFHENVLVTGSPGIRFYAGAPIVVHGAKLGTLCVIDRKPRHDFSGRQISLLSNLAHTVATLIEKEYQNSIRLEILANRNTRQELALAYSETATWHWDLATNEVDTDDLLGPLFGLPASKIYDANDILNQIHPKDKERVAEALDKAIDGNAEFSTKFRTLQPDGSVRWIQGHGRAHQVGKSRKKKSLIGVNFDVSEQAAHEDRLHLLIGEMRHRIKNSLALASSLASMTAREVTSLEDFLPIFRGRLEAISAAQGVLDDTDTVSTNVQLTEVVEKALRPFTNAREWQSRFKLHVQNTDISQSLAQAIALILYELGTNSSKYGALTQNCGHTKLEARLVKSGDGNIVQLDWVEHIGGPANEPDKKISTGFGYKLVDRLVRAEGGTVERSFEEDTLTLCLRFPVEDGK